MDKDTLYTAVLLACGPLPDLCTTESAAAWLSAREQWRLHAGLIMGKSVDLDTQESFELWCINKAVEIANGTNT